MTVGMFEVAFKAEEIRRLLPHGRKLRTLLARHAIPCVIGPRGQHFIIDHHHIGRALWNLGFETALIEPVADLSGLDRKAFWKALKEREWLHPVDASGVRHGPRELPAHLSALEDDPYRSLAGSVRSAGGFAKSETPFAEFLWADFFRPRIRRKQLLRSYDAAVATAFALARSPEAAALPGYGDGPR